MIEIIPNWHPIFVHFSVGLLLTAALFHVVVMLASREALKQVFTHVANWNLWIGVIMTIATVVAGWIAFNSVNHDTPSHLAMIEHRNWAIVTFAAFVVVGIWSLFRAKKQAPIRWPLVAAVCAAGLLLISTAWHGGELVYRYGLGVMSLPNPDAHAHGEDSAHEHNHDSYRQESAHQQGEHEHSHDQEIKQTMPSDANQDAGAAAELKPQAAQPDQSQGEHSHAPEHEHHDHDH